MLSKLEGNFPYRAVFVIFIAIFILRAVFALSIGFVDDDAYHWTWTKDLDWSYFDHPGMIAWLEYLSTAVFGDTRLGIRLPSFVCFAFVIYWSWKFTRELFDPWAATFASMIFLWTPLWGFGGFVSSPEPPFIVLWVLAAWVFWQGVREDGERWSLKKTWLCLGVIMGLGFNTKFPMVLIAPGFGLYLLMTRSRRKDLLSPWPWVGALIAALCLWPVIHWNIQHDWPSFKFQFHDRHQGESFSVTRWLGYLGTQVSLLSPGVYVSVILALVASVLRIRDPRWRLLFCLTVPSFLIFYSQPFKADYKPHWMGPAYFLLTFGVGALWSQGLHVGAREWIRARSRKMLWWVASFLILMNLLIYTPFIYPWMPKVFRMVSPEAQWEPKNDISNEVFGWPELGTEALKFQAEIEEQIGVRPFLAGHRYETTAQIWKATGQRTYMLSRTRSHFTVTTSKEEYRNLYGHDALMIATDKYPVNPQEFAKFDSCEAREFKYFRHDELARIFTLHWCKNFQGILR
jgi:hypothetical protein